MMNVSRNGFPLTASQWQELEHQVLIFKYMVCGIPVPPDLLYSISRNLDSFLSSKLLLHQPHHMGWSCLQMGFGRKIDPEPGRCRRTDGKKWRCSKEAYPDSKYCERHMQRSRNRSRKPVEVFTTPSSSITSQSTSTPTPTAIPFSSITKNTSPSPSSPNSLSFSSLTSLGSESHPQNHSLQHPFNHYYHCSGESPNSHFSSQHHLTTTPSFMLESDAYSYVQRAKMKVEELPFFSETYGTMRSRMSETSFHDSWHCSLEMGSSGSNMKQSLYAAEHSYPSRSLKHDYNGTDSDIKNHIPLQFMESECENKKVMHHFFDELPPKERNLWHENEDKLASRAPSSTVQLSLNSHLLP